MSSRVCAADPRDHFRIYIAQGRQADPDAHRVVGIRSQAPAAR
jgi:hypothetical protein